MKYQLAVSPINWRNDDMPDIGASNTLEKFFTEASAIGYDGVEMGTQYPRESQALQQLLAPFNLGLASGWFDLGLLQQPPVEQLQEITPHMELLRTLGCKVVVVCETQGTTVHNDITKPANDRHIMNTDEWRLFTKRLNEFALMMKDNGIPLTYHGHMATVIESGQDIDRMMEECPDVDLLFDSGHLAYGGTDPLAMWHKYESRINHIHLKDIRRSVVDMVRNDNKSLLDGVIAGSFTVPSDGDLDYDPIMQAIEQSSYNGWLVVEAEQDPAKAPADVYAKKAYDYIHKMLG